MRNTGQLQPSLQGDNRAGGVGRATTNFDLAPAGLASQRNQHALARANVDLAAPILAQHQGRRFRSGAATSGAQTQHGAVAQNAQRAAVERFQSEKILAQDGLP